MKQGAAQVLIERFAAMRSNCLHSTFRRNFAKSASASLAAQALAILLAPVLTRLYTADDFAAVAVFTSLLSLLVAVATLRFDWSIPNARSSTTAAALVGICLVVMLASASIVGLVALLLGGPIAAWTGMSAVEPFLIWLPIALIGASLQQILQGWFVRSNDLTAVSYAQVLQGLASAALALAGGVAAFGAAGLIAAAVCAAWVGIVTQVSRARGLVEKVLHLTAVRVSAAFLRYWREATSSTLAALVNTASFAAPVLMLASHYPAQQVGWYALMTRLAGAPIGILTKALSQAFWAESSRLARDGRMPELGALYLRFTFRLSVLAIPVVLVCAAGPIFAGPLFGELEWSGSGEVLFALAPYLVGVVMFSPTNHLIVLRQPLLQVYADGLRLVMVIGAIGFSGWSGQSFVAAVFLASMASLAGHLALFLMHRRIHVRH